MPTNVIMPPMSTFTQTYLKELFDYLSEGVFIRKMSTGPTSLAGQTVAGSAAGRGYKRTWVAGKKYTMHRLIWFWHHGTWPEALDHINGNRADNRIENLRECTHTQNMWNAKGRKSQTGIKGVTWDKRKNRYRVRFRTGGERNSFGYFKTLEEARIAVEAARTKYHGEFARHE